MAGVDVGDVHNGAVLGEQLRRRRTDAVRGTRNHGHLVNEKTKV
jgi:hypothetical protein